jgi:N-acetyl-anhydromuramyl-L-alanine amidase AmpD
MRRRQLLKLTGAGIASTAFVGTASAHVEDPYADRWVAADPSNYTNSSRGAGSINWLIMHVTQGSYGGTVSWFQNPDANVSTQYVIRNSDGHATQMVHNEDIAWHAGGQNYNTHSIGFEHEGFVGQTNFTDALYRTSADIARWLCERYDIPKEHPTGVAPCDARNGGGIIGHHQVPESDCGPNDHTDPGSTWDWDHYMSLVHGGDGGSGDFAEGAIVESTTTLNTREQPGTGSTVVGTMPTGADAEIVNGPVDEDGYRWWGLHWLDHGVWGWSVERYLDLGHV